MTRFYMQKIWLGDKIQCFILLYGWNKLPDNTKPELKLLFMNKSIDQN